MRGIFIRYGGTLSKCGRCMLLAESPDAAITRERNHEENNAKAAFACCRSLARCGVDRPAGGSGWPPCPKGRVRGCPRYPAASRCAGIGELLPGATIGLFIAHRKVGTCRGRSQILRSILVLRKLMARGFFALQFLKNEGCASNGKARRIRFVRASGYEVPASGIRSFFRARRPEQGSRVIPWFIYIVLLPMVA